MPTIRQHGSMTPTTFPILSSEEVHRLSVAKMDTRQKAILEEHHEMDLAFAVGDTLRVRMNVYRQRGTTATVCRLIPIKIRSLDDLGIPEKVKEFTKHRNGFVLVTGPTGSGKTTTLAAMIDLINESKKVNIITLEDPIEFVHRDKEAYISQREIGLDTENFHQALRHVLRQAPDIILIGEMRDMETMNVALQAAETGHLVFATLHTSSAAETLDRVSNMFEPHERPMLWLRLSVTLRGVISQKLIPRADGKGRLAGIEVMDVTPTIGMMLEKGQSDDIYSAIRTAGQEDYWGMQTMNQCLLKFFKQGLITEQIAIASAGNVTEMKQMIRMAQTKGEVTAIQGVEAPTAAQAPQLSPGQYPQAVPGQQPRNQGAPQIPGLPPLPGVPTR